MWSYPLGGSHIEQGPLIDHPSLLKDALDLGGALAKTVFFPLDAWARSGARYDEVPQPPRESIRPIAPNTDTFGMCPTPHPNLSSGIGSGTSPGANLSAWDGRAPPAEQYLRTSGFYAPNSGTVEAQVGPIVEPFVTSMVTGPLGIVLRGTMGARGAYEIGAGTRSLVDGDYGEGAVSLGSGFLSLTGAFLPASKLSSGTQSEFSIGSRSTFPLVDEESMAVGAAHPNGHGFSIREINPHAPTAGGDLNCVKCAIALENTLAGYPTQAMPGLAAKTFSGTKAILEQQYNGKLNSTNISDIQTEISGAGNGSRGIVIGWQQGTSYSHAFNVVNQNGVVKFLDGQIGGNAVNISQYDHWWMIRTR